MNSKERHDFKEQGLGLAWRRCADGSLDQGGDVDIFE